MPRSVRGLPMSGTPSSRGHVGRDLRLQISSEHERVSAVLEHATIQPETDLLGYPLRRRVLWSDDRNQVSDACITGSISHSRGRLGRQTLTSQSQVYVVAHLDEVFAFDVLDRETTVPDEAAIVRLDDPQPEAVLCVVALVPLDPPHGVVSGPWSPTWPDRVGS